MQGLLWGEPELAHMYDSWLNLCFTMLHVMRYITHNVLYHALQSQKLICHFAWHSIFSVWPTSISMTSLSPWFAFSQSGFALAFSFSLTTKFMFLNNIASLCSSVWAALLALSLSLHFLNLSSFAAVLEAWRVSSLISDEVCSLYSLKTQQSCINWTKMQKW